MSNSILRQRLPVEIKHDSPINNSDSSDSENDSEDSLPTFTPPSFTIKELLAAIPAHCFERSWKISALYLLRYFTFLAITVAAALYIDSNLGLPEQGLIGNVAKWTAWNAYW